MGVSLDTPVAKLQVENLEKHVNIPASPAPVPQLQFVTYWAGPIDESLLLCWYLNLKNPNIRQVIYLDQVPDIEQKKEQYPFLKEIRFINVKWNVLFNAAPMDFDPELPEIIPHYKPNFRSDIFRYLMLITNGGGYMDADQCLLNAFSPAFNIWDKDFGVYADRGGYVTTGLYRFSSGPNWFRLKAWLALGFKEGGPMRLSPNPWWGEIGPLYFARGLNECKIWPAPNENFVMGSEIEVYGWDPESAADFCNVWNQQLINKSTGIHLYSDLRYKHREAILKLAKAHFDYGAEKPMPCVQ